MSSSSAHPSPSPPGSPPGSNRRPASNATYAAVEASVSSTSMGSVPPMKRSAFVKGRESSRGSAGRISGLPYSSPGRPGFSNARPLPHLSPGRAPAGGYVGPNGGVTYHQPSHRTGSVTGSVYGGAHTYGAQYGGAHYGASNAYAASQYGAQYDAQFAAQGGHFTQGGQRIIGEYTTEELRHHQRTVMMEETYDEVVVIPHTKLVEKVFDEPEMFRQRIVEVEVPQYVDRVVEVPQVEYIEVDVPYPETHYVDNIIHKPRFEMLERIVEVPKIIYQEKIVEVPEIQYREFEVERIVEVEQEQIETVLVPHYVPQYVEIDVPEYVDTRIEEVIELKLPLPVEQIINIDLKFPKICPKYAIQEVPVYVPRFIEVPIPMDKLDDETLAAAQQANMALTEIHEACMRKEHLSLVDVEAAIRNVTTEDWGVRLERLNAEEAPGHMWHTNFIASQIPVIMDAVIAVTSDIQALGAVQAQSQSQPSVSTREQPLEMSSPMAVMRPMAPSMTPSTALHSDEDPELSQMDNE